MNLEIVEIAKLDLAPGDILVVKTDAHLSRDVAESIRAATGRILPETKCIILDGGIDITVLRRIDVDPETSA